MPQILLQCDGPIPERCEHIILKDSSEQLLPKCNIWTEPGDMTERGCAFAGCRGVVGGPIKDVIHLVHGPIGCAFYTWGTRPNWSSDIQLHRRYCFCTDLTEEEIVFGGEKRLYQAIIESYQLFPEAKGILVYATCSVGLIGDDLDAVCKKAEEKLGIKVVPFHCEGFRGVSQSAGHHIGNHTLMKHVVGSKDPSYRTDYDMNLIGEYNIKGDLWAVKPLFESMGIRILCTFTGDASIDDIAMSHTAKLNLVHCQRSANYIRDLIHEAFGTPYLTGSFFGTEQMSEALRKVGTFFGLEEEAEKVIQRETEKIKDKIAFYREKLMGKQVIVYQGAPRAWHWPKLFEELGMELIVAATTFGHKDDYEKLFARVKDGTLIIDNPNALELEEVLLEYKPDLFIAGLKEKYLSFKLGIPFVNGHSYDSGPYAGFEGYVNFARDIYQAIYAPVWKLIR